MGVYTVYHIPGVKIGVTSRDAEVRVFEQKYTHFEVLEKHYDIRDASLREKQLQEEYGYKVDKSPYIHTTQVAGPRSNTPEAIEKMRQAKKGKPFPGTRYNFPEGDKNPRANGGSVGKKNSRYNSGYKFKVTYPDGNTFIGCRYDLKQELNSPNLNLNHFIKTGGPKRGPLKNYKFEIVY